jgi:hypothetical protein
MVQKAEVDPKHWTSFGVVLGVVGSGPRTPSPGQARPLHLIPVQR